MTALELRKCDQCHHEWQAMDDCNAWCQWCGCPTHTVLDKTVLDEQSFVSMHDIVEEILKSHPNEGSKRCGKNEDKED